MRLPNYRNRKYLDWLHDQPCLVCKRTPCDPAHQSLGWPSGVGTKPPDSFAAPLCRDCHQRQHQIGEVAFWSEVFMVDSVDRLFIHGLVARWCIFYFTMFLEEK
jgi:hypothetical protein